MQRRGVRVAHLDTSNPQVQEVMLRAQQRQQRGPRVARLRIPLSLPEEDLVAPPLPDTSPSQSTPPTGTESNAQLRQGRDVEGWLNSELPSDVRIRSNEDHLTDGPRGNETSLPDGLFESVFCDDLDILDTGIFDDGFPF